MGVRLRAARGRPTEGITLFLVDRDSARVEMRPALTVGRDALAHRGHALLLAEAAAQLAAARVLARRAAWLYDRGEPCDGEARLVRLMCADAGRLAADRAVRTFNGGSSAASARRARRSPG